jgi:hypothetical protein
MEEKKLSHIVVMRYGKWVSFEYNEETGLYHYGGSENYAGYTPEELYSMDEDNSEE